MISALFSGSLPEAEKVGFEPTVPFGITGFQDQLLKPLGHLSEQRLTIISCIFLSVNSFLKLFSFFLKMYQYILIRQADSLPGSKHPLDICQSRLERNENHEVCRNPWILWKNTFCPQHRTYPKNKDTTKTARTESSSHICRKKPAKSPVIPPNFFLQHS